MFYVKKKMSEEAKVESSAEFKHDNDEPPLITEEVPIVTNEENEDVLLKLYVYQKI